VTRLKAIRNKVQISGLKAAQLRDGAALVKFLAWLQTEISRQRITELSAAEKLYQFRTEQASFQGLSFETISAYGAHAAIVHYSATPETDILLKKIRDLPDRFRGSLSGWNYRYHPYHCFGKTHLQTEATLHPGLKGTHPNCHRPIPADYCRQSAGYPGQKSFMGCGTELWHGTGHGIGFYLNVHEGPQAISYYRGIGVVLEPGMVISNEPGYYQAGEFGIRIENLILVISDKKYSSPGSEFLTFETVSYCPIDLTLVDKSLLSHTEIQWLNQYHRQVRKLLSPLLTGKEVRWLERATRPI